MTKDIRTALALAIFFVATYAVRVWSLPPEPCDPVSTARLDVVPWGMFSLTKNTLSVSKS